MAFHSWSCDWKAGFVPDTANKRRIGYITSFDGIGLSAALKTDISVLAAFNNPGGPNYTPVTPDGNNQVCVVGVIESLTWSGGAGDALSFSFYVSSDNATSLKTQKQQMLPTNVIKSFGHWVGNYDESTKQWYEETYPNGADTFTAQVNAIDHRDVRLHVADEGVRISPDTDQLVYNCYIELVPAADAMTSFVVASAPGETIVMPWGLLR